MNTSPADWDGIFCTLVLKRSFQFQEQDLDIFEGGNEVEGVGGVRVNHSDIKKEIFGKRKTSELAKLVPPT